MLPKRLSNMKAIRSFRLSDEAGKQYVILEERKVKPQLNKHHLIFQYTIHRLICLLFNIYKLEQDDHYFHEELLCPHTLSLSMDPINNCSMYDFSWQKWLLITWNDNGPINWHLYASPELNVLTDRLSYLQEDEQSSLVMSVFQILIALYFFTMRCLCKIRSYE